MATAPADDPTLNDLEDPSVTTSNNNNNNTNTTSTRDNNINDDQNDLKTDDAFIPFAGLDPAALDSAFDSSLFNFEPLDPSSKTSTALSKLSKNSNKNSSSTSKTSNLSSNKPSKTFSALSPQQLKRAGRSGAVGSSSDRSYRAIRVPGPRMIHMRRLWKEICDPVVSQLKLQIRMNSKKNLIEVRTSTHTTLNNAVQKGSDFIRACVLGFEIKDAIALVRMDDIFLESFDIRDVKFFKKKSDHWLRAVGRVAGQYGKIKYSIENSTNTRIVIFGFKVHILGSYTSIRLARNAISRLVMGSAPGNVYAKLRVVSNRMKNRF